MSNRTHLLSQKPFHFRSSSKIWGMLKHIKISWWENSLHILKLKYKTTKILMIVCRHLSPIWWSFKNTTEQIAKYINWALELAVSIYKADKVRADIANISGLTAKLVNPRDRFGKCEAINNKTCDQDGHKLNDHCKHNCEFTVYNEGSNRLNSIEWKIRK